MQLRQLPNGIRMSIAIWTATLAVEAAGQSTAPVGLDAGKNREELAAVCVEKSGIAKIDLQRPTMEKTCACAAARLNWDPRIDGLVKMLGQGSTVTETDRRYALTNFVAALASCAADELKADALEPIGGHLNFPELAEFMTSTAKAPDNDPAKVTQRASALLVDCKRPEYPAQAARNNIEGTSTIGVFVNADGKPLKVRVDESSGDTPLHKYLDFVASAYLASCPFKAARNAGGPVASWTAVAYEWNLH